MDYSGQLFQSRIGEYMELKAKLPSWGKEVDKAVLLYAEGMEHLIVGSAEWCFHSKRYLKDGMEVKRTRVMPFKYPQPKSTTDEQ